MGYSPSLSVQALSASYGQKPVLDEVSFELPGGVLAGVVGPNGAGKSTLLRACLDLQPGISGTVAFFGKSYNEVRKQVAYVPQRESIDWDFPITVTDVVLMGVYPSVGLLGRIGADYRRRAHRMLEQVGLKGLEHRQISELSGGQQQRVFIARALAQAADIYLMDEPLAAVDAGTEKALVQILKNMRADNKTCLVVHHDLSTVSEYFDWVILLNSTLIACGPVDQVFTRENLERTYRGELAFFEAIVASAEGKPER